MTQHCGAHPTDQKWLAGLLLVAVVALDGAAELANAADSPVSGALRGLGYPQRAAPAAASKRLGALPVPGGGATAPATRHTCSLSALLCVHAARLHVDPGWYRPYSNFFPG